MATVTLKNIGLTNTDPTALRPIFRAILAADVKATRTAVRDAEGLPANDAVRALTQAYLRDFNLGRCTPRQLQHDSLTLAVFRGLRLAQTDSGQTEDEIADANNAVLALAAAAANLDEPVLADLLLRFEPGFSLADDSGRSGAEGTSAFFAQFDAPRCAAWALQTHTDGAMRHEELCALERAETRLRKNATRWIRELGLRREPTVESDDAGTALRRRALHTMRVTGEPSIVDVCEGVLFSFGFCMLGRPELYCAVEVDDVERKTARMHSVILEAMSSRRAPEPDVWSGESGDWMHALRLVLAPFARLRAAGVPAVLAVRV